MSGSEQILCDRGSIFAAVLIGQRRNRMSHPDAVSSETDIRSKRLRFNSRRTLQVIFPTAAVAAVIILAGVISPSPAADKSPPAKRPSSGNAVKASQPPTGIGYLLDNGSVLVVGSSHNDWAAASGPNSGGWNIYRAPKGVEIVPVSVSDNTTPVGLITTGASITELAAYCPGIKAWSRMQLPTPARGQIELSESTGSGIAVYKVGNKFYAVSGKHGVWDALDIGAEKIGNAVNGTVGGGMGGFGGVMATPAVAYGDQFPNVICFGDKLAKFGTDDVKWSVLDLRTGNVVAR